MSGGADAAPSEPWRLLLHGYATGLENMAVDEAILEAYDQAPHPPPPTLRIYGWSPAALSLGRSQRVDVACEPEALLREGIDVVRRPTGGGAVLHEHERTYAVVGWLGTGGFPRGVAGTYARIARALVASVSRLGVAAVAAAPVRQGPSGPDRWCFERLGTSEIAAVGRKLVGSAQARRRRAFLQHGSIPLRLEALRMAAVSGRPAEDGRFVDLGRAAGRVVTPGELDRALVAGFEESFGTRLVEGSLDAAEARRAEELRATRLPS